MVSDNDENGQKEDDHKQTSKQKPLTIFFVSTVPDWKTGRIT